MRILMVGDVVGEPGRKALRENLTSFLHNGQVDFVVVNGENAAGGMGITREIAKEFFRLGVDAITLGNHAYNKKEIISYLDQEKRIIRPANYPPGTPGHGFCVLETRLKTRIAVINLAGRVFMQPLDCPFRTADKIIKSLDCPVLIDFHAEATSEKIALGRYLDGRVSAVLGTHTHVQTADEKILPGGTAYITDVGMCGPVHSVIGNDSSIAINRFITQMPSRFEVAVGLYQFNGVLLELDDNGAALSLHRIFSYE